MAYLEKSKLKDMRNNIRKCLISEFLLTFEIVHEKI